MIVAGKASPGNNTGCMVCHSVDADGARLVVQHGPDGYKTSSWFDLHNGTETVMAAAGAIGDGRYTYPALSPDGTVLFSHAGNASGIGGDTVSQVYTLSATAPGATALASTGIPAGLNAAMPAFSPDGKHVAFNYYTRHCRRRRQDQSLAMLDFNAANARLLEHADSGLQAGGCRGVAVVPADGQGDRVRAGDGSEPQLGAGRDALELRRHGSCSNIGAHGELWWVDLTTKQAARLDRAQRARLFAAEPQPTPPNNSTSTSRTRR